MASKTTQPCLRYIYRGGSLKHGSIVIIPPDAVNDLRAVTPAEIFNLLQSDARVDAEQWIVSFYDPAMEGYVQLNATTVSIPKTRFNFVVNPRLDLRLDRRAPTTSGVGQECASPRASGGGYFALGVYGAKSPDNIGTLWRSAYNAGAAMLFTIGQRFQKQSSDTTKAWVEVPLVTYADFNSFAAAAPHGAPWVAVETGGDTLTQFEHPRSAVYILGAEDTGLPEALIRACAYRVTIPSVREASYNLAVSGSIIMYDRLAKLSEPDAPLAARRASAAAALVTAAAAQEEGLHQ